MRCRRYRRKKRKGTCDHPAPGSEKKRPQEGKNRRYEQVYEAEIRQLEAYAKENMERMAAAGVSPREWD
jgi:hypothetical protein